MLLRYLKIYFTNNLLSQLLVEVYILKQNNEDCLLTRMKVNEPNFVCHQAGNQSHSQVHDSEQVDMFPTLMAKIDIFLNKETQNKDT